MTAKLFFCGFFSLYKNSSSGARAHKNACTFLSMFSMWNSSLTVTIVITDGTSFHDGEIFPYIVWKADTENPASLGPSVVWQKGI